MSLKTVEDEDKTETYSDTTQCTYTEHDSILFNDFII